ncbi:MAG: hypothetical protein ACKVP7_16050 [Hyphomicrobiaceae bacterium]
MPFVIALALATLTLVATSPTAEACSARGQYCSYPAWAANAFEGPTGSTPRFAVITGQNGAKRKSR